MRRWIYFALVTILLLAAGYYGCTKERSTNPYGDGTGETGCLGCHGDREFLESVLAEAGGIIAATRGDG